MSGDKEGQGRLWTLLARNCEMWRAAWGLTLAGLKFSVIQRLMPEIKQRNVVGEELRNVALLYGVWRWPG